MDYSKLTIEEINKALNALQIAEKSYIMTSTDADKQRDLLMTAKEKKILETYPIRVWQATNGKWKAHIPDKTKDRGRRTIQGETKQNLDKNIIADYLKSCDERLLFKNYYPHWLINCKAKRVKGGTIDRNHSDYLRFIEGSSIDSMMITEITTYHIKDFLNDIINEHHLTRRALNNLKSIFTGLFQDAFDAKDIPSNPMIGLRIENTNIRTEKPKTAETEVFDDEDFSKLIGYMYEHYLEYQPLLTLSILLNFQLGLRVGELCTLKKSDVHFNTKEILIDRTERSYRPCELVDGKIVRHKTVHIVAEGDTKCGSNRTLSLTNESVSILKECFELHKMMNINSEFLFINSKEKHVPRERYNEILEYYCKKVFIDKKSIHKTRKTTLTRLFEAGLSLEEVMEISGHRDKNTLLKHYIFTMNKKETKKERVSEALSTGHFITKKVESTQVNPT
ncbi:MAG: tyrosine-type recombinase/integrase [Agathobacter sp.]|nr:tyrosine-type recombinase/integrase [Agathobacter sp.]